LETPTVMFITLYELLQDSQDVCLMMESGILDHKPLRVG